MRVLREFDASGQHVYLVSGEDWSKGPVDVFVDHWAHEVLGDPLRQETPTTDRKRRRCRHDYDTEEPFEDLQWIDVSSLGDQVLERLGEVIRRAREAGERSAMEWSSDHAQLNTLFREITGSNLNDVPSEGEALAHLMVQRAAKALQFRNVGIKPYVLYNGEDKGYVRHKSPIGLTNRDTVANVYVGLNDAYKWYKRQRYRRTEQNHGVRIDSQGGNPYEAGLVHYRVVGFVDEPTANLNELAFTYIHEVSHAWADTTDNVDWGENVMFEIGTYIRSWVSAAREDVILRAVRDPVKLLTSADFVAYAILRTAGFIEPDFLLRNDWRDDT